jgi:hypothetical protein
MQSQFESVSILVQVREQERRALADRIRQARMARAGSTDATGASSVTPSASKRMAVSRLTATVSDFFAAFVYPRRAKSAS